jgi:hypothetical protein
VSRRGRPPIGDRKLSLMVCLRLSTRLYDALACEALRRDVPVSRLARHAIANFCISTAPPPPHSSHPQR